MRISNADLTQMAIDFLIQQKQEEQEFLEIIQQALDTDGTIDPEDLKTLRDENDRLLAQFKAHIKSQ